MGLRQVERTVGDRGPEAPTHSFFLCVLGVLGGNPPRQPGTVASACYASLTPRFE